VARDESRDRVPTDAEQDEVFNRPVPSAKADARAGQNEFKRGYEGGRADARQDAPVRAGGGGGTVKISNTKAGTTIAGLMAWSVMFALFGNEVNTLESKSSTTKKVTGPITEGGKIIIGGTIGTAILLMISHAGPGGQQLATGLALVTAVSSMLIWGKPVFGLLEKAFGSTPTAPVSTTLNTSPTPQTTGATK